VNKKKNKKLLLSLFLLIILVGFNGIMIVNGGTGVGESGLPGGSPSYSNDCKLNCSIYSWDYGARVSLVDENGNQVGSTTVDYWNRDKKPVTNLKPAPSSEYYGTSIRQNVVNGTVNLTSANYWSSGRANLFSNAGFTESASKGKRFNTISDTFRHELYTKIKKEIESKSDGTLEDSPTLIAMLGKLGLTLEDLKDMDEEHKYFIQVEPLVTTYRAGKLVKAYFFTGTITEYVSFDQDTVNPGYAISTIVGTYVNDSHEKPSVFIGGVSSYNKSNITDSQGGKVTGTAVSFIYLNEWNKKQGLDCYQMLKVVHANATKYPVGSAAYDEAIAAIWNGPTYKGSDGKLFEFEDASGNKYTIDKAYKNVPNNYWLDADKKTYKLRTETGGKASCYAPVINCNNALKFSVNKDNVKTNFNPVFVTYDGAVEAVRDGTYYFYGQNIKTKNEDGVEIEGPDYVIMDKAYLDKEGLLKQNYKDDLAWCGEAEKKKCDEVVSYINSHPAEYPKTFSAGGTALMSYDEAIAKVRAGTFSYEVKEIVNGVETKKTISVDQAYNNPTEYYYLIKANYDRDRGGVAACDPKDPEPTTCGSQADVKIDECETGQTHFKDNEGENNWLKCETAYVKDGTYYTSDNTGHEATTGDYEGIVGNLKYCQVFCYEEVETNFPTEQYVKAGRTFFWGLDKSTGTFGTIKVKKKCSNQKRTDPEGASGEGYLYKKWDTDYKNNERALITNYLAKGDYEEAKKNEHISASCSSYCARYCGSGKNRHCCLTKYNGSARSGWTNNHNATSDSEWMGSFSVGRTVSGSSSGKSSCSAARTAAIRDLKSNADSLASAANNAYTGYKNNETPLLNKIRQCTNNIKYVYKTTVYFVFDEPENTRYGTNSRDFHYNDKLIQDPEGEDEGYNKENVVGGRYLPKTCTAKIVYSYICTGSAKSSKCSPKNERVLDCKQVTWEIEGEWDYKYDEEYFTWFSLKYNSSDKTQTLMNKKNKPDEDENLFYSIGFGLPTAFSLTSGKYLMHVDVGNLGDHGRITDSDPSYVGEKNYNAANGHFWPVAEEDEHGHGLGFKYECEYTVDNQIFQYDCQYENGQLTAESAHYCDPTEDENSNGNVIGIDVAYRLVSLLQAGDEIEKAFPGIGGEGRPIGENWGGDNWSSEEEGYLISMDESIKEILRSDIYESEAMYEILLDVGTIQYIRKDNEKYFSSGKDPYTSFDNVICKSTGSNGEHKYCASDFISDLASSDYGQQGGTVLMGTCIPVTDTEARAEEILNNGCNGTYTYPNFSWVR